MEKRFDLWFVSLDGDATRIFDTAVPQSEVDERIRQIYESYTPEGFEVIASPSE